MNRKKKNILWNLTFLVDDQVIIFPISSQTHRKNRGKKELADNFNTINSNLPVFASYLILLQQNEYVPISRLFLLKQYSTLFKRTKIIHLRLKFLRTKNVDDQLLRTWYGTMYITNLLYEQKYARSKIFFLKLLSVEKKYISCNLAPKNLTNKITS